MVSDNEPIFEESETPPKAYRDELYAFLMLAVFLAPILAVIIVGGYGFIVWMSQLVLGPPTV